MMKRGIALLTLCVTGLAACGLLGGGEEDPDIPGKIVFSALDDAGAYQIYTMNADGSGLKQITDFSSDDGGVDPSWSPDGRNIVFSTSLKSSSNGLSLYIMNADGSGMHPMNEREGSPIPTPGSNADWSPDGRRVAWDFCVNCQVGTNYEIFIYEFQADSVIQLTDTDYPVINTNPTWSPGGNRIAFVSNRDYYDADTLRFRRDLYMINVDGTNLKRLTHTGNATKPIWSPDGTKIAYEWNIQGNNIFIYDIVTEQISEVESGLEFAGNPLWNNQGTELLVFGREIEESQPEIRLIKVEDGAFEILHKITLNEKAVGRGYDWNINQN